MSTHVESHCSRPKVYRWGRSRPRYVRGDLWACDCGQVWRVVRVNGYQSSFLAWRSVDLIAKESK